MDRKKRVYLAARGRPQLVPAPETAQAQARLRSFQARGMNLYQISAATGGLVSPSTVTHQMRRGSTMMRRETYEAVMAAQYVPPVLGDRENGARMSPVGTVRRMRAMNAAGFPNTWLLAAAGINHYRFFLIQQGEAEFVHYRLHAAIVDLYKRLEASTPEAHGIPQQAIRRALTNVRKKAWAPSHCWDADTIDDPGTLPEWTGECGTLAGYYLHVETRRRGGGYSPTCDACNDARRAHTAAGGRARRPGREARIDRELVYRLLDAAELSVNKIAIQVGANPRTIARMKNDWKAQNGQES